ncbi:MAG: FKBP-type peptidyl-prolyl cis-trans isomerase [Thiomicrospira sp.]|jgi:FKBP-type peptidyl-prolyl cis-trans isomerase SlpA|nr:FKBP-type peptidyl-prolyl cis-trans isomerase [Thiomicrospira sp.]
MSLILKQVTPQSEVVVSFTLALTDGTLVDQATQDEPYRFRLGDGSLLPNLESLLVGLEEGTSGRFFIPPEEGFGFPDPMNVHKIERAEFPQDMLLKEGDIVGFNTPTGEEVPGQVVALDEAFITVDFNHPLSGQMIVFDVKIEKIVDAG